MSGRRPRVLLGITVYNGRAFVPRALISAKQLETKNADIDVIVLDDCSPEPGFSEFIEGVCAEQGVHYYRSPRNLGIVRDVNLGLLTSISKGYDFVIISNSDVIYSRQTVDHLLDAFASDPRIGSVTAWSNNVSIYSIPNTAPDTYLASQDVLDWLASWLSVEYARVAVDIPAGISFCILIPTPVLQDVGLMDPVYGRGYCEETDWTLRSLAKRYRATLAPAAFVYHQGRGSTLSAGMLAGGHSTVPANEAIIDYRYPLFRTQVDAFVRGGILDQLKRDPLRLIMREAGRQFGHTTEVGPAAEAYPQDGWKVRCNVVSNQGPTMLSFRGFEMELHPTHATAEETITAFFTEDRGSRKPFHYTQPLLSSQAFGQASYPGRV